jgi:hypothetical protein
LDKNPKNIKKSQEQTSINFNKNKITSNQIKVKGNNWIKIPRTLKNHFKQTSINFNKNKIKSNKSNKIKSLQIKSNKLTPEPT